MSVNLNLSGKWDGVYAYPPVPEAGPVTPFLAEIVDCDGRISGTIIEPTTFRGGTAHASMEGFRSGTTVDFVKTYHGAGEAYDEAVAYAGSLSADGNVVSGHWMMADWNGPFEMTRQQETVIEEEVRAVADAEIQVVS